MVIATKARRLGIIQKVEDARTASRWGWTTITQIFSSRVPTSQNAVMQVQMVSVVSPYFLSKSPVLFPGPLLLSPPPRLFFPSGTSVCTTAAHRSANHNAQCCALTDAKLRRAHPLLTHTPTPALSLTPPHVQTHARATHPNSLPVRRGLLRVQLQIPWHQGKLRLPQLWQFHLLCHGDGDDEVHRPRKLRGGDEVR